MNKINVIPYATITVPCVHNNTPTYHNIILYTDGSLDISQHANEDWSEDSQILEALGGGKDLSPCIWWSTKVTNSLLHEYIWNFGTFYSEKNPDIHYDPTQWKILFHNLPDSSVLSRKAVETLFNHYGVVIAKKHHVNSTDEYASGLTIKDIEKFFHYYMLLIPHANEVLYNSIIASVIDSVSLSELAIWLDLGIPSRDIQGYVMHNIEPYLAKAVQDAVEYRIELHCLGRHLGIPQKGTGGHAITKVGTPLYWVDNLTSLGVERNRIPSFIARTAESGALQWRQTLYNEILEELPPQIKENTPTTWIVEAVASTPEDEVLENINSLPDWGNIWIYTTLKTIILENLASNKDPMYWESYWFLPSKRPASQTDDTN